MPIKHFKDTAKWIKKLEPELDEALLISVIAHDTERAFRKKETLEKHKKKGYVGKDFLRIHQEEGAKIIEELDKI